MLGLGVRVELRLVDTGVNGYNILPIAILFTLASNPVGALFHVAAVQQAIGLRAVDTVIGNAQHFHCIRAQNVFYVRRSRLFRLFSGGAVNGKGYRVSRNSPVLPVPGEREIVFILSDNFTVLFPGI